jgi:Ion channel
VTGATEAGDTQDRFELVFLLLISSFVLEAILTSTRAQATILLVYLAALLLVLRATSPNRGAWPLLPAALTVVSVTVVAVALVAPGPASAAAVALWLAVVLVATIGTIVRRVLRHPTVTLQTLLGSLSAYLLIGFLFMALYSAVAHLDREEFFVGGQPATSSTLQYFSFVTMTTTGYGDFTAAGTAGRSLAVLEALLGQIFLVTLVARLVAMFGRLRPVPMRSRRSGADRPEPPS